MTIGFQVHGLPASKGSMKSFVPKGWKRAILTNDSEKTKPWENVIRVAAIEAKVKAGMQSGELLDCPIQMQLHFRLIKPKSRPKKVIWPEKKPDMDKLLRAVFDALTGSIYTDDARVVHLTMTKNWACAEWPPGVLIEIVPLR